MKKMHGLFALTLAATAALAYAQAPELQQQIDLMPLADTDQDGKVTLEEYLKFSGQGWDLVSQGAERIKPAELDPQAQMALLGTTPDKDGYVTRKIYLDAAPARFKLLDTDRSGALSADELNGKTQP